MSLNTFHARACALFGRRLHRVRPQDWEGPTPCAEWDVRALVGHVVSENLWTPPLLAGRTIEQVGNRFDGDVCGADPVTAFEHAASEAVAAVGAPGALSRTVHLSYGEVPGEEYAWQVFVDHLVHAWDLARALEIDEHLPTDLVDAAAAWFGEREPAYRSAGMVGPRVPTAEGADPETRLLAAFGRGTDVVARA